MRKPVRAHAPIYGAQPEKVEGLESLAELALDLRWSWDHGADHIWNNLDPDLWQSTRSPWVVLQTVSRARVESVLSNPEFRKILDDLLEERKRESEAPSWFQTKHAGSAINCVAYFSMEFMLGEALPIYSGGLGNVAGDQLKAASDLGVPVVGIGLLWQQGYFRQVIDENGAQQALYPYNDPEQLPISPLRQPDGEWMRLRILLPGYTVWLRVWHAQVGRANLYLLDSNDAANSPLHRGITSELYGGGTELRLKQELALGIGGWRLMEALNLNPDVCHLNEGHAAFAVLERARGFMRDTGHPFSVALAATRAGNLFTTHTAVPAGFDRFPPALIEQYLSDYAQSHLGLTVHDLLALGRQNPDDPAESFNMAYLAIRGSGSVNGVSKLHGEVSRSLFASLFPRWPQPDTPVGYVTNGIHVPSWNSPEADEIWTAACGKNRWVEMNPELEHEIRRLSNTTIWKFRTKSRQSLVEYARQRLTRQLTASNVPDDAVETAKTLFDPDILTLGFARRFATYKRPNLLLHDPDRLARILTNSERPVQLILAGKAHPDDRFGQALIQQWTNYVRRPNIRPHAMFLADYDMELTEHLAAGVDVWLNTPRRPWEACGTSGMKLLVNGGLNLSELDGWWVEAYDPAVGWALGDGNEHGEDPAWDAVEAESLYDLLEQEIIPEFYRRDARGVPTEWVARIRESMARLTPRFSASRAVAEYTEQHYLPAAAAYHSRAADKGAQAAKIVDWQSGLDKKWSALRFGDVTVETRADQHVFEACVILNAIDPQAVNVELYAEGIGEHPPVRQTMTAGGPGPSGSGGYLYVGAVSSTRPVSDYTARVTPHFDGVAVPLEDARILWQK